MTLAEIIVCLAVVSIGMVMMTSFAIFMRNRVNMSNARLDTQQDLMRLEATVEGWLDRMSQADAVFFADGNAITATAEGETYTLRFAGGILTATQPNKESLSVRTEQIQNMTFAAQSHANGDTLFFCTILCHATGESVIFAINPRAGETVGGAVP